MFSVLEARNLKARFVDRALLPVKALEGNPSLTSVNFWSLPGSLVVLWRIVASLQSLPLVSHGLLLCVCVCVCARACVRVCVCVCVRISLSFLL